MKDPYKPNFIHSSDVVSKVGVLAEMYLLGKTLPSTPVNVNIEVNSLFVRNKDLKPSDLIRSNLLTSTKTKKKKLKKKKTTTSTFMDPPKVLLDLSTDEIYIVSLVLMMDVKVRHTEIDVEFQQDENLAVLGSLQETIAHYVQATWKNVMACVDGELTRTHLMDSLVGIRSGDTTQSGDEDNKWWDEEREDKKEEYEREEQIESVKEVERVIVDTEDTEKEMEEREENEGEGNEEEGNEGEGNEEEGNEREENEGEGNEEEGNEGEYEKGSDVNDNHFNDKKIDIKNDENNAIFQENPTSSLKSGVFNDKLIFQDTRVVDNRDDTNSTDFLVHSRNLDSLAETNGSHWKASNVSKKASNDGWQGTTDESLNGLHKTANDTSNGISTTNGTSNDISSTNDASSNDGSTKHGSSFVSSSLPLSSPQPARSSNSNLLSSNDSSPSDASQSTSSRPLTANLPDLYSPIKGDISDSPICSPSKTPIDPSDPLLLNSLQNLRAIHYDDDHVQEQPHELPNLRTKLRRPSRPSSSRLSSPRLSRQPLLEIELTDTHQIPTYMKDTKKYKYIKVGKVQKFVHLFEEQMKDG